VSFRFTIHTLFFCPIRCIHHSRVLVPPPVMKSGSTDSSLLQETLWYNPPMASRKQSLRTGIGILLSVLFIYLAFRQVDFNQMAHSFRSANYWYLFPTLFIVFLSHYLRALRWRYFLDPILRLDMGSLFSSLMVGYAANVVMPAHLGEFVRAHMLSRRRPVSMGCAFATIVVERIIDVFTLIVLLGISMLIHPFPSWVVAGGYVMLGGAVLLFGALALSKKHEAQALKALRFFIKPLPSGLTERLLSWAGRFLSGIAPLQRRMDYLVVAVLSVLIWLCYGLVFHFCLYAFDFVEVYNLAWYVALVLLVITTISVVVPSSPGYVGTFHYLTQLGLGLFSVPAAPALSYAAVVHAVCFLPVFLAGLALANHEGMSMRSVEVAAAGEEGACEK
jgi:glycosyltransferase 2 family protein